MMTSGADLLKMLAQWPRAPSVPKVLAPGATGSRGSQAAGDFTATAKQPTRSPVFCKAAGPSSWRRCTPPGRRLGVLGVPPIITASPRGGRNDETQQRVVIRTINFSPREAFTYAERE